MTAPYVGDRRAPVTAASASPAPQVTLSASERSHRHKVVLDAHAAVVDNLDDDVARLIARRKLEVATGETGVGDRVAQHANHDVARLLQRRGRDDDTEDETAPSPGDDVARLLSRRPREE